MSTTVITRVNPLNKNEERRKFLFDPLYNPQFIYEQPVSPHELLYYGEVSDAHLSTAMKVLERISKEYGSHELYIEKKREPLLGREEVEKIVKDYIAKEKLDKIVTVKFSSSAVARTSMYANTLTIRLPVTYSRSGLLGMLNHDVGTHLIRTLNDRKQVWYGKREQFKMHPYLLTEEGLATLHAYLAKPFTIMRRQAIYYFAVHYANSHSFSELNTALKPYVPEKDHRWEFCLRAKRGMKDTSVAGAFSKDQTYFAGAIEVWRWLKKRNFDSEKLYMGKVSLEDVDTLQTIISNEALLLPTFLSENKDGYRQSMLEIGKQNYFDKNTQKAE